MILDTKVDEAQDLEFPDEEQLLDVLLDIDMLLVDLINSGKLSKKLMERVQDLRSETSALVALHNLH